MSDKSAWSVIPSTLPPNERRSGMARPTHEESPAGPRPPWLKVRLQLNDDFFDLRKLVHENKLNTVCESASCPNIGECWSRRSLTFMILGNVCTRSCGFCDVQTGRPGSVDPDEPRRVAEALRGLGLRYAVITSVDRDDLPDGGAFIWAETIRSIRREQPNLDIEVLTPDFKGDFDCVATVLEANPTVFAHNVETVPRLHKIVRPQATWERSLSVLKFAREFGSVTKTGIMLGLGERDDEVIEAMKVIADHGVEILNLGQYMRPSSRHLPVERWVHPDTFAYLREEGMKFGFVHIEAGPLVRSSYRADEQAVKAAVARHSNG